MNTSVRHCRKAANHSNHYSTTRHKESSELRNIMEGIKYLQHRVIHLPLYESKKKVIPTTPKTPGKSKSRQSKTSSSKR